MRALLLFFVIGLLVLLTFRIFGLLFVGAISLFFWALPLVIIGILSWWAWGFVSPSTRSDFREKYLEKTRVEKF